MLRFFLLPILLPQLISACEPQHYDPCPFRYYWLEETNSCYKVEFGFLNVSDANAACKQEGADLASIHSKLEDDFLVEISKVGVNVTDPHFYNGIFIGLVYQNKAWSWSDGSPFDYINWAAGEPNNMGFEWWGAILPDPGRSDYNPNGGQWNNVDKLQRGYICKKTAI